MKNILRVKINGSSVIKFCQSNNKEDFFCYFPPISQGEQTIETHFSFHTKTGRKTFKTTSVKTNNVEILPNILEAVKGRPLYVKAVTPKDLDLFKGKVITFNDGLTFYPWFRIALNLKNSTVSEHFGKSKTKDEAFQSLFDIRLNQEQNEQVTISSFIGKNIRAIPDKKDKLYDLSLAVAESNFLGDKYTIIFCLSYDFPDIKRGN